MADARALQVQEAQLLGAIEHPEIAVELQAVDDDRRIVEVDVLWPQVAVRLHHATAGGALREQRRMLRDEFPLQRKELFVSGDARRRQHPVVGVDLPPDACHERRSIADRRRGRAIELSEQAHDRSQRFRVDRSLCQLRLEQAGAIETPHADQPVHDRALTIDREPAVRVLRQGRGFRGTRRARAFG